MGATRSQKIRLGAFALVTAALLVTVLAVFAGMRLWKDHDHYAVEVDGTVFGLEVGADVRLNGVRVGKVTGIDIVEGDIERVRVDLEVEEGTPVRADTRAILAYRGITGLKIVDLRRGSAAAPPLPPGSVIPVGETVFDQLEREADDLLARTRKLLEGATALIDTLGRTGRELEAVVAENRAALREAIASMGGAARDVERFMDRDARALVDDTRGLIGQLEGVVQGSRGQVRAAMLDLRRASASVKELARDLRQRPSRLLFSRAPKERDLP